VHFIGGIVSRVLLFDSPELLAAICDEEKRSRKALQSGIEAFKAALQQVTHEREVSLPDPILDLQPFLGNLVRVIQILERRTQAVTYPEGLSDFVGGFDYFSASFPKPVKLEVAFFYVVCEHMFYLNRREGLEKVETIKTYARKLITTFPDRKRQKFREKKKSDRLLEIFEKMLIFHFVASETQCSLLGFQAQSLRNGSAKLVNLNGEAAMDPFKTIKDTESKIRVITQCLGGKRQLSEKALKSYEDYLGSERERSDLLYDIAVLPMHKKIVKISSDNRLCASMFHALTTLIQGGWGLLKAEGCLPFFKTVVDTLACSPCTVPSILNALVPFLQQERDCSRLKSALIGVAHLSLDWVLMDADMSKLLNALLDCALSDEECVQKAMSFREEMEEFFAVFDGHKLPKGMSQEMYQCGVTLLEQGESVRRPRNPLLECSMLATQSSGATRMSPKEGSAAPL